MFKSIAILRETSLANLLFYCTVFLIPFQKRFFLFNSFSFDTEYFIEYNSFYLSLPEITILILIFLQRKFILNNLIKLLSRDKSNLVLILFIVLISFNLFNSINLALSIHKTFHFLIWISFVFLGIHLISNFKKISLAIKLIIAASFFQSLIAIFQFLFQRSLGLKFLGESILGVNILGVAKIDSSFGKIIRAYGTEPHPNILGGFLMTSIIFLIFYLAYLSKKSRTISNCSTWNNLKLFLKAKNKYLHRLIFKNKKWIVIFILFINSLAIIFTFSRTAIFLLLSFLLLSLLIIQKNKLVKKIIYCTIGFIFFLNLAFLPFIKSRFSEEGSFKYSDITLREIYSDIARVSIKNNPTLGTGAGTFVFAIQQNNFSDLKPWEFQPVHNIYLLAASDLGIVLFSLIIFSLINFLISNKKTLKKYPESKLLLVGFVIILISGFSDHYLYSFSQGISILAIFLTILLSYKKLSAKQKGK